MQQGLARLFSGFWSAVIGLIKQPSIGFGRNGIVGLFFGTQAPLAKKVKFSLIVGAIIYVLNLVRNTGIIWFYGQGEASFWVMHNAIGKGGSLLAMIGIAFAVFKWFPEFFKALVSVLDLPDRDGPIERHLKIGRRRPEIGPKPTPDAA